jgi:hypothetical protein
MKTLPVSLLSALLLCVVACSKKSDSPEPIGIQGYMLRDGLGNPMGVIGAPDNDWTLMNWNQLSAREQSFLSFADNIDMSNTSVPNLSGVAVYPNPVSNMSYFQIGTTGFVKLKVAIVDSVGNVLHTQAIKSTNTHATILFDVSNESIFRSGMSLRYYYSLSATGNLNFKAGYGDVKICRLPGGTPVMQCF